MSFQNDEEGMREGNMKERERERERCMPKDEEEKLELFGVK